MNGMKKLLTIVFGLLTIASFGQKRQKVDLDWKIGKQEKLSYMTVMSEIDTSSVALNFGGLYKSFSDSTGKGMPEAKEFFKKLNAAFKGMNVVTTLTNKGGGVIDIVAVANRDKNEFQSDTTDSKQDRMIKMMQAMGQGVLLRGSVYEAGGIHSFWTKTNQKNLISIFFELPTKPVQIGDTWKLDVNLISNDENFDCDSSYNLIRVTLIDIKKVQGETIAVLKYDIVQYVNGNFSMAKLAGKGGGQTKTMMKFAHQALAEFSIDKGRWIAYDGVMTFVASGVMTANKKTKLTLTKV